VLGDVTQPNNGGLRAAETDGIVQQGAGNRPLATSPGAGRARYQHLGRHVEPAFGGQRPRLRVNRPGRLRSIGPTSLNSW
jgi:hypothetical protein